MEAGGTGLEVILLCFTITANLREENDANGGMAASPSSPTGMAGILSTFSMGWTSAEAGWAEGRQGLSLY